jgi:hypothetical protein
MKQFHGSRAKSAPNVRSSRAQPTSVSSISGVPPRRRATTPIPAIDAPLTASAPRLMPTPQAAGQPVERRQHVEEDRARVVPVLSGVEADEHLVAADVADLHLREGMVGHREPVAADGDQDGDGGDGERRQREGERDATGRPVVGGDGGLARRVGGRPRGDGRRVSRGRRSHRLMSPSRLPSPRRSPRRRGAFPNGETRRHRSPDGRQACLQGYCQRSVSGPQRVTSVTPSGHARRSPALAASAQIRGHVRRDPADHETCPPRPATVGSHGVQTVGSFGRGHR